MYGLANGVAKEYAQRGYVGFSVEYRTDTTLVGSGPRPPSLCQWVQDHVDPASSVWLARRAQCERNLLAAQNDAQGAVRWLRAHATQYGIDANRIAVGGFSAGAVTAANLAYRSDDVGTTRYFSGDDLSVARSKVQAAIGASGCAYSQSLTDPVPSYIGAGDAPISFIHAETDAAVPYACAALTAETARSRGLVAELRSYCDEAGHAMTLYDNHKAETDDQWTTFLARELTLYTGMRPASAQPRCPGT
jgi:acetyl esterase/lipase